MKPAPPVTRYTARMLAAVRRRSAYVWDERSYPVWGQCRLAKVDLGICLRGCACWLHDRGL
jgi:hypothetical protein